MTRSALITGGRASERRDLEHVQAYLPANYTASRTPAGDILITGEDVAGWTLHDYVIPRLASGLIWAAEVDA